MSPATEYKPSEMTVFSLYIKHLYWLVHRQSMGQRVKIKKKYHNQNTKVEIN